MISTFIPNAATIRVLEYLVLEPEVDFSKADVSRYCGVSWKQADEILKNLEDFGIITITRKISRARMYKISSKSEILQNLIRLDLSIMDVINKKEASDALHNGEIYPSKMEVLNRLQNINVSSKK
ncbi:Uncharacterised protein [Candidatus Anstonella stagnisolia]|nr:Uncharacterised protein [Candidatus Anstonella stagnisolia]